MPESPQTAYSPTSNSQRVALATLSKVANDVGKTSNQIPVHFNPVSLLLTINNELKDTTNNERKQYIAKASAKLTMDLIFDTTDTGRDVTQTTRKIQEFLLPAGDPGKGGDPQKPPPLIKFEWGRISFKGIAENYKETLDFFSADGVPLRSSINLTLSRQDQVFDNSSGNASNFSGSNDNIFDAPAQSAAGAANALQNPGAARGLAAANGEESLRFGSGAPLSVGGGINLKGPVAFASGGTGLSLGIGVGAGLNVGLNAGIGGGIGGSASAGISGMARLSATEGAFNGLSIKAGVSAGGSLDQLDPEKLMPDVSTGSVAIGAGARFAAGGKLISQGASGLGAETNASARITFD